MKTFKRLVVAIVLGLLLVLALAPSEGAYAAPNASGGHWRSPITLGALNAYGSHWDAPHSGNYPPIEGHVLTIAHEVVPGPHPATIYNFIYNYQTPTLIGHDPNNGTASTYNQWCNQGAPTVTGYLYDNNNGYMLSTVNFPVYAYQCEQQYAYWTSGLGAGVSYSWWFCGYGNPGPTYCTAKLTWRQ